MKSIMKVLLCDSSAALELGGDPLMEAALRWKLKLAVTDLLFERELRSSGAEGLKHLGLRVEQLDPDCVQRALLLRRLHPRLSFCESCTLALASQKSWVLLTKCPTLERIAAETAVEFRDLEWLRAETSHLEALPAQELASRRNPTIRDDSLKYEKFSSSRTSSADCAEATP